MTATTGLHVQKLLRQADEVVFSFDGDSAGRRAAWRALEGSLPELTDGKQVRFLFLPQGEDPDTYVRAHGKAGLEALLADAVPLSRYLLDELTAQVDLASAEGRASLVHAAKPLVTKLQKTAFRVQVLKELAERSRLSLGEVEALCGLASVDKRAAPPPRPARARTSLGLWRKLLRAMLDTPQLAEAVTPEERRLLETDPEFAPVVALVDTVKATGVATTGALFEAARGSPYAELYGEILQDESAGSSHFEEARADLEGVLAKLELSAVEAEYGQLLAHGKMSDAQRLRMQAVQQRLSELKGAAPVGLRSSDVNPSPR